MIIYRFGGLVEAWKGCGMLPIEPEVMASHASLMKHAKAYVKKVQDQGLRHLLWVQRLEVFSPIGKEEVLQLFRDEDPEFLVRKKETLMSWTSHPTNGDAS